MAFEAYLQQGTLRPSRGRRITYTASVLVHAAAVLAAIAYSFWHIEELNPPRVAVTFFSESAAPLPPPPPPPLGGGAGAPKHKTVARPKVEVAAKTPPVVQPKTEPVGEAPKEAPKEIAKEPPKETNQQAGSAGNANPAAPDKTVGVSGGVANGTKGGVVGGTGTTAGPQPKILPPQMGAQLKLSGADPDFPAYLRQAGTNYLVLAKIVVAASGMVESVSILKHAHPALDNNVVNVVKTWRFKPMMANGTPVPFAYVGRFEFKSE